MISYLQLRAGFNSKICLLINFRNMKKDNDSIVQETERNKGV
jgi:lipopolysaccharide/colanic/teichoic acid biosynthesis glycosyltransferase